MEDCSRDELLDGGFIRSLDGLEWVGSTISWMEACLRVSASVEFDNQGCRENRTLSLGGGNDLALLVKVCLILASRAALNLSITERRSLLAAVWLIDCSGSIHRSYSLPCVRGVPNSPWSWMKRLQR